MTDSVPARCTTCGTDIPEGRSRCPGCGRVFGEDNRCPSCNAITTAEMHGGVLVCTACGKPRERKPGTVVVGGGGGGRGAARLASVPPGATRRASSVGLRAFGILSLAAGVLAAMVAGIVLPGVAGVMAAVIVGGLGVGGGALALRAASHESAAAEAQARRAREMRILSLAEQSGGRLTATEVARALNIATDEADRALTAMADGTRVSAEVTSEGLLVYEFRELASLGPPRVRVAEEDTGASGAGAGEAEEATVEPEEREPRQHANPEPGETDRDDKDGAD